MITYSNIKRFDNIPFEEYLKFDGYSHSFLKREHNGIVEPLTITDNITIGKLVDGILTDPSSVDMSSHLYGVAKLIAHEVYKTFGSLIKNFESQISFTADVECNGFIMPTTGRLDWGLKNHAVIDLKCTKSKVAQIPALIEYMGYKNQLWHYCKMYGVDRAYLMFHSIPEKKTIIQFVDCSMNTNDFWSNKIELFGRVEA